MDRARAVRQGARYLAEFRVQGAVDCRGRPLMTALCTWCRARGHWLLATTGALLVIFLAAPLLGLAFATSLDELRAGLRHPLVWPALRLSFSTTSASLLVVVAFGTPLSWTLA